MRAGMSSYKCVSACGSVQVRDNELAIIIG